MFEWNPEIRASSEHFQSRAQVRIGVAQRVKWPPVQRAARRGGAAVLGKLLFFENLVPGFFGVERSIIKDGTQLCLGAALRQNTQLFFRASVITREAQKFEQESPLPRVRRVVSQIGGQLPLCFAHL